MSMAKKLEILAQAPDFELTDTNDNLVRLSEYRSKQEIVLVLLRSFA